MKLLLAVAFLCLPFAALAQETTIVTADAGFIDYLTDIIKMVVDGILVVALPVLVVKGFALIGVKIEEAKRDSLVTNFRNRAGGYINELGEEAKELKMDVGDPRLAKFIQQAQASSPGDLAWAGLDSKEIARRILEQVPQILATPEPTPITQTTFSRGNRT